MHQVVVDSINRTDLDLRKSLFSNVVLSGGSTLCKGFGDRLLNEVKKLALKDVKVRPSCARCRFGSADAMDCADQDLRPARAQVLDVDRRQHPRRAQHLQKGRHRSGAHVPTC